MKNTTAGKWFGLKEMGWLSLGMIAAIAVGCLFGWGASGFESIPDKIDPSYREPLVAQFASMFGFIAVVGSVVKWRYRKFQSSQT